MKEGLEKYGVPRHRYIGKADLLVLESNEDSILVKYTVNDVYYTQNINTDELEKEKASRS